MHANDDDRRLLLKAGTCYALASFALPVAVLLHDHFVPWAAALTLGTAVLVSALVARLRELGRRRTAVLGSALLAGPLSPWVLQRQTRRLRPVLLLMPRAHSRR